MAQTDLDAAREAADRASAELEAAQAQAELAQARLAEAMANQHGLIDAAHGTPLSGFVYLAAIFALACFVGYYVVWSVTPALHTPLMSVTNAISSVVIVGALIAVGAEVAQSAAGGLSRALGVIAVALAAINIFGGFLVTQRMLSMYKKKERKA